MVRPSGTVEYTVTRADAVRAIDLSPEFHVHKPDVMASARLVAVCEWPCMDLLRRDLKAHECSLGVWQHVEHLAPIAIGARLTLETRCVTQRHSYSEWRVVVHDEHERVGLAELAFVTVDREDFERRRLVPKQRAPERIPELV